jgi:hypothetical protein
MSGGTGRTGNYWLWAAIALSVTLQAAVIYVPFLQRAFSTASLSESDWLFCTTVASGVLWLRELSKVVTRAMNRAGARASNHQGILRRDDPPRRSPTTRNETDEPRNAHPRARARDQDGTETHEDVSPEACGRSRLSLHRNR